MFEKMPKKYKKSTIYRKNQILTIGGECGLLDNLKLEYLLYQFIYFSPKHLCFA
jgi:hypothetical protein